MFYEAIRSVIGPGMVFFLHMILMDSTTGNVNGGESSECGPD